MTDLNAPSTLLLAVDLDGPIDKPTDLSAAVLAAQDAGFALVTFADSPTPPPGDGARIEAGTRAAYVAPVTDRIGLAPTLHVATTEPFHLATQLASLDHASHGRGAWVVGTSADAPALATVGGAPRTAEGLVREVADVVEVARLLWDSWEDDAVVKDVATGRFVDSERVHHVDFEGDVFSVKGPLITPRPPQGQVVVIAEDGLGLGELADIALVSAGDGVAERVAAARAAGTPRVFVDVEAASVADAVARVRDLVGLVDGVRLRGLGAAAAQVVPALGDLVRRPAAGATLRDILRLPRPANRYAA